VRGWCSGNANSYSGVYRQVEHPEEALLIAARTGNLKKVESLLNAGVDPNTTSENSYTALSYAAAGGHLEIIKLLLKNGANVNKQARHMKNSLSVVAGSSHVEAAKLLLANGAKMMVNANGSSVVHEAVIWRQPEMLKFLLSELKVGVDLRSSNGRTPLHYAISRMEKGQNIRNQLDITSVKILLKHGADPGQQFTHNNVKRSATGLAEFKGLDEVVALLKAR
jgi:ankyrin repeat protein